MTITRQYAAEGITSRGPTQDEEWFSLEIEDSQEIVTPGTEEEQTHDDAVVTVSISVVYDPLYRVHANLELGQTLSPWLISNDESIAVVNGEYVKRVADGTVHIGARNRYHKRTESKAFTRTGGDVVTEFVSWVEGSLAKAASDALDGLISGKSASSMPMFSPYPAAVGSLSRNADCWINSVDVSGISAVSNYMDSDQSRYQCATLVSARDAIWCRHWSPTATRFGYVSMDGETTAWMEVDAVTDIGGADLRVVTFTEDVPAGITPMKVMPANVLDYLPGIKYGVPGLRLDQQERASVGDCYRMVSFRQPTNAQRLTLYEDLVLYDSGNPACLLVDLGSGIEPILLTVWTYGAGGSGSPVHQYLTEIDAAMSANGSPYSLTEANLSGFANYG